ncbi:helix-hairpin-helix domain-containing protein [Flavobacterium sp. J49]|uniref:helix-hairpin-helix domain-containing protein n=1 Tax=Flavobacterium sp. J49 TaxID=2718534 RepID=UPI0015948362|nr:helix-hairpin-helix domain-containing protein [Flavobacterium sp. J49]MBF6640470.1 helix-hairpin-helix domain-containing protein [Flavobacterium sp. J49]NIC01717.1 helix-hairpin-helix domain-containing protein [Flavobacterium sp. J49]
MTNDNSILQSILSYSKSQRIGIILLFLIIVICQGFYLFNDFKTVNPSPQEQDRWLAHQSLIDSFKLRDKNYKPSIYPFNPNFITDFKGYKLGMSVAEIDRLLAYRKQNKFVNSAEEFQAVTKISDSLLITMSPYFKFPDWVKNKKEYKSTYTKADFPKVEKITILDINEASKEDLMKIYGIGDKISDRILEQKDKLGAFVSMEQMNDVWGLSPEVIEKLNLHFEVKSTSKIKKVSINNATVKDLAQFPFFRYPLAKEIVIYRSMHGDIQIEDLSKIKGFPVDKIKIIALYLEF